ncbi:SSI family serine proteinase inhibitor [Streptomyces sp. DSM 42041]|uniref:SSI family serine proteinase inhibitor n=1 Tax=Streptomyces hazeniae TaxID=3075538 RepID=A0ABU2NTI0_9ACTN|nr:SSI family serine proteinase inhibitor [Streptomyces sp. DSM 42041]MDT0379792.1 SSI family serine proteinase inhibitor [Streptomyces sp. DSM 42041]
MHVHRARRPRRKAAAAHVLAALAVVTAAPLLAPAPAGAVLPPVSDHLVLTVSDSGHPARDGRFELFCHPAGGDHPRAKAACARLDEVTVWGSDPFAPAPGGTLCTSLYGGPATAHVEGMWAGRPVNADFGRATGCETARWDDLVPFLPRTRL